MHRYGAMRESGSGGTHWRVWCFTQVYLAGAYYLRSVQKIYSSKHVRSKLLFSSLPSALFAVSLPMRQGQSASLRVVRLAWASVVLCDSSSVLCCAYVVAARACRLHVVCAVECVTNLGGPDPLLCRVPSQTSQRRPTSMATLS